MIGSTKFRHRAGAKTEQFKIGHISKRFSDVGMISNNELIDGKALRCSILADTILRSCKFQLSPEVY